MSMLVEDENGKVVCIALCKNDFISIMTMDKKVKIIVKNVDGKLIIEEPSESIGGKSD